MALTHTILIYFCKTRWIKTQQIIQREKTDNIT